MKTLAITAVAALVLAACTVKPVHVAPPPPVPQPAPPRHEAPPPPRHEAARPAKPEPKKEPPYVVHGPLTTKLAGAYMDGQEAELRVRLQGSGLRIARQGDALSITMTDDYLFGTRLGGVSWNANGALNAIAAVIQLYDRTAIQIGGYTDTTGSPKSNMRISQTRAQIIADALTRDGVAPGRISARGYGETHLLVPTGDNVKEPRNRRVEIRIVPKIEA